MRKVYLLLKKLPKSCKFWSIVYAWYIVLLYYIHVYRFDWGATSLKFICGTYHEDGGNNYVLNLDPSGLSFEYNVGIEDFVSKTLPTLFTEAFIVPLVLYTLYQICMYIGFKNIDKE